MKKILACILALSLIFSAVGTATFTAFAEETEVVEQTPAYTFDSSIKDWTFAATTVKDNTLFENVMYANYVNTNTGVVISKTRYENPFSTSVEGKYLPIADMANWLKTENGMMRFYVRLPWQEGTPALSYNFGLGYQVGYTLTTESEDGTIKTEEKTAYPETHATVNVPADGLWHEIRISVNDLNKNIFDTYVANSTTVIKGFYPLRVMAKNDDAVIKEVNKLYFSNFVEYYNEAITAEIDDGNIEYKVSLIDSPDGSVAGLSFANEKITDNKFYREARKITRTDNSDMSSKQVYPYRVTPNGDELDEWFAKKGDMRTYVKNDSDSEMVFKMGIKGSVKNTKYGATTQYPVMVKDVIIPANSGWMEIRLTYAELNPNNDVKVQENFTAAEEFYSFYLFIQSSDTFLVDNGDSLYITPLEVYNRNIVEGITTDFAREYKQITLKNTVGSWRPDPNNMLDRTETASVDLPFTSKILTYTANETFNIDSFNAGQIGFTGGTVNCADFAEWAYHNPEAQLRMWVKSTKDITLTFEVLAKDNTQNTNRTMLLTLNITGSPDWQEILLDRSDFVGSNAWSENAFNEVFTTETNETSSMNIFLRDVISGVQAGDSFSIAQRMEFFTDKAYDKGDITRDGVVDARDVVRSKKCIVNAETSFVNGDINGDDKLNATDLGYLRGWIMNGAWA